MNGTNNNNFNGTNIIFNKDVCFFYYTILFFLKLRSDLNTHHDLPKIMRWTEGRPRKTKLGIHDEARFRGIIGREIYVHSGGFKSVGRLCIGGDCFEMMWSSNGDDL